MQTTFHTSSTVFATMITLGLIVTPRGYSDVIAYTNKTQWQTAVGGNYSTVTFTEVPLQTLPTTQYSVLGVLFDGSDQTYQTRGFLNDGVGLDGNGNINLNFTGSRFSIATDFPGLLVIRLYLDNALLYTSPEFGGGGNGFFGGLISTTQFNRAVLIDPLGEAAIDDLYFGPPVPAPGALIVVGLAAVLAPRSRRRGV